MPLKVVGVVGAVTVDRDGRTSPAGVAGARLRVAPRRREGEMSQTPFSLSGAPKTRGAHLMTCCLDSIPRAKSRLLRERERERSVRWSNRSTVHQGEAMKTST